MGEAFITHRSSTAPPVIGVGPVTGNWEFYGDVTIPEGITQLKFNLFQGQTKITSLKIPSTLQTVKAGSGTFYNFNGCTGLQSVIINDGSNILNTPDCFRNCINLKQITIPFMTPYTYIQNYAFDNCTELSSLIFKSDLNYAFILGNNNVFRNTKISSADAQFIIDHLLMEYDTGVINTTTKEPIKLKSYPRNYTFANCTGITSLNTYALGEHELEDCENLQTLYISKPYKVCNTYEEYNTRKSNVVDVTIAGSNGCSKKSNASSGCKNLTKVVIQDMGYGELGGNCFYSTKNLTSVEIDNTYITKIRLNCFKDSGIQKWNFSDCQVDIGPSAFYSSNIADITVDQHTQLNFYNTNNLSGSFFAKCNFLTVSSISNVLQTIIENNNIYNANYEKIYGNIFKDSTFNEAIILKLQSIKILPPYCFFNCQNLTELITDSETAVYIGSSSFESCKNLETVNIQKAASYGTAAFKEVPALKSVYFSTPTDSAYSSITNGAFTNSAKGHILYHSNNLNNLTLGDNWNISLNLCPIYTSSLESLTLDSQHIYDGIIQKLDKTVTTQKVLIYTGHQEEAMIKYYNSNIIHNRENWLKLSDTDKQIIADITGFSDPYNSQFNLTRDQLRNIFNSTTNWFIYGNNFLQ